MDVVNSIVCIIVGGMFMTGTAGVDALDQYVFVLGLLMVFIGCAGLYGAL